MSGAGGGRVYVVARSHGGLAPVLRQAGIAAVEHVTHERMPERTDLEPADVLVLDLEDLPARLTAQALIPLAARAQVVLVSGDRDVAAGWLQLAADHTVVIEACPAAERERGCPRVVSRVLKLARSLDPRVLAHAVLAARPVWVQELEAQVQAICADPWGLRRPAQLAVATERPMRVLRARCAAAGNERVEHFITEVRLAIREHAIERLGLRAGRADLLAGIADRSNGRRQAKRARRGLADRLGGGALGLLLSVLVASCGGGDRAAQAAPDSARERGEPVALPVVGALVRRGDLVLTVRTTGRVRAERLVSLKAEIQGTVAEVLARPGQRVDSGQVLARFDPRPFDLAVREAEAGLADAQVQFNDLSLGDDSTDTSDAARRRRDNFRLRAGLPAAEARLDRARLDRERAVILAPFGGVVDEVGVVPGQRVGAGDLVARIVDLGRLVVEASVLEHDLLLLRAGGQARVTPSAGGGRSFVGRIAAVLPVVDSTTRAGRVLVRVRADGLLRPGMYADVELESERLRDRVLVPAAAVIERDGRPLVFRARGGRAEWVYVQAGRSNGRETEVQPDSSTQMVPVAAGDTVLVEGHLTLTHDATIRVKPGHP